MKLAIAAVLVACSHSSSSPPPPGPEPDDWCRRIVAGAPSTDPDPIALANAHFTYRYFGVAARDTIDAPLSAAFAGDAIDLDAYAALATDACAVDANPATLGPASVELRGDVAWIVPGTGDIAIPDGAAAIAIDLRGLPSSPDLADALARVTTATLASPLPRPPLTVTTYDGHPDSWFQRLSGSSNDGIYTTAVLTIARDPWPGTASTARPIAAVTDVAMPPLAAELALALRTAQRASLVGHSVVARVAESDWRPVGTRGLAIRTGELASIPDEIAADLRTDDADTTLASADDIPAIAATPTTATRAAPRALSFYDWPTPGSLDAADLQAAVAVAYGAARGFFRIYDPWPTVIDTQYLTSIVEAKTPVADRADARAVLERFAASLHDGHVYIGNLATGTTSSHVTSVLPVGFDVIAGEPVVNFSTVAQLHLGDTVVTVDGMSVADFLAPYSARVSSATPLNHAVITAMRLGELEAPTRTFTLRAPDGTISTETIAGSGSTFPPFGPQRASGTLADLGASDVYYIDINGDGGPTYTIDELLAQLDDARSAAGVIIDGRGYPTVNLTEFLARIIGTAAPSPQFHIPTWTGASITGSDDQSYIQDAPTGAPYTKPVAILVGPETQSFAEDIIMILEKRTDLMIVGRQTSGSNGNITSVAMPGGWGMTFTGMQVRFSDGSPFHGIGITPTIPSQPTAADFAAGIDRELADGIAAIHAAAN